jgi:hypothetical protein
MCIHASEYSRIGDVFEVNAMNISDGGMKVLQFYVA